MAAKIRKYQDYMIISARALLAFGLWGLLRVFFFKASGQTVFQILAEESAGTGMDPVVFEIMFIIVYLIFDVVFRIYVGRSALAEGRGRKRSIVYLVVAALYILISLISYIVIIGDNSIGGTPIEDISAVIIDLTTLLALVIIIVSSINVRRMRKIKKGAEENAD